MGEERRLLLAGEGGEPVPEIGLVLGQPLFPGLVARVDRLGRGRVLQPLRLHREAGAAHRHLHRRPVGEVTGEDVEAELVQHGLERDGGRVRQLVAQRQRPLRGQLGHEAVRERLQVLVVLVLRPGDLPADGDDGALNHGRVGIGAVRSSRRGIGLAVLLRLADGRLVLRPDVAAVDRQRAFGVDADEDAGAGDVGRIIGDGPIVEGGERRLDLAEAFVHLVRQLVGAVILPPPAWRIRRSARRSSPAPRW